MRRWAVGLVLGMEFLAVATARGATPGATIAERRAALELRRRLIAQQKAPRQTAYQYAVTFLRRAYLVDVEPAHDVAKFLLRSDLRIRDRERLRYFGWALDAMARGAGLRDVLETLRHVLEATYTKDDKTFFLESFLGNASLYASPAPLVKLLIRMSDNGVVGRRRRDFFQWVVAQVRRGENPAYILRLYDIATELSPVMKFQRDFLDRCYRAVRRGVPPLGLVRAVERIAKRHPTRRRFDENFDRLVQLYFGGRSLETALQIVAPPEKEPEAK